MLTVATLGVAAASAALAGIVRGLVNSFVVGTTHDGTKGPGPADPQGIDAHQTRLNSTNLTLSSLLTNVVGFRKLNPSAPALDGDPR